MSLLVAVTGAVAADLKPETLAAFNDYIRQTEARLDERYRTGAQFLWVDESADRKRRLQAGEVIIQPLVGKGSKEVAEGMIHDWIGAVFIPGVGLEKTLARIHDYDNHKNLYKPEVIDSKLLHRDGDHFRVYLRLLKKKVITVVLDTQHEVQGYPLSGGRRHSRSYTTSVVEVENAGKPDERKLPAGKDHGFLWRLNSYWRFQERDGGVWIECEAISLSRDIPTGLGWLIEPIVRGLPSESLANTLRLTRTAMMETAATSSQ